MKFLISLAIVMMAEYCYANSPQCRSCQPPCYSDPTESTYGCRRCICPQQPPEKYCPPIGCKRPCFPVTNENGCPFCYCRPKSVCPPIAVCNVGCRIKINKKGCKYCQCDPICPPLYCHGYCYIRHAASSCPICECP